MMTKRLFPKLIRRRSRGQALVEFALILPVLLILLMVLIEVARLFSAWLIIENSAREAARYAVTGLFDPIHCTDGNQCDSSKVLPKDQREALEDHARLLTIEDVARGASSGILSDFSAARDQRSFIDIVVCSTRRGDDGKAKYAYLENPVPPSGTVHPRCVLANTSGTIEEDAGGPGDRVIIAVLFDHPLITPLRAITDWIPLMARREMIVERYRTVRIQGLPPTISGPTATYTLTPTDTPTGTPSPTDTPTNTPTNTPTRTPTNTPTSTASPTNTPTPSCTNLEINQDEPLYLNDSSSSTRDKVYGYLLNNSSNYIVELTTATVNWPGSANPLSVWHDEFTAAPGVIFDRYLWNGAIIVDPATNRTMTMGMLPFSDSLNNYQINTNSSGDFALDFTASLRGSVGQMYRHGRDWIVGLDYMVGDLPCHVDLQGLYGPVITPSLPSLVTGTTFDVRAAATDPDPGGTIAEVYFEVSDNTNSVIYSRTDGSAPYCLRSGCTAISSYAWPNGTAINSSATYTITFRALDNDPHQQYTRVVRTIRFLPPTLTPTTTPTITPTPSRTPTPTITPTPSRTPTITQTPTRTPTQPTPTFTRTPTRTPTQPTPTFTWTPTRTPTQPTSTRTPTPTNTPTSGPTFTRTPTRTPTRTVSPSPTATPTRTVQPSATPTSCGFDGC
jgi:hypothetical protein